MLKVGTKVKFKDELFKGSGTILEVDILNNLYKVSSSDISVIGTWWFSTREVEEEYPTLNSGVVVELRDGTKCMVIDKELIDLSDGRYLNLKYYEDDLTHIRNNRYDIMKICAHDFVGDNFSLHVSENNRTEKSLWTWTREGGEEFAEEEFEEAFETLMRMLEEILDE